MNNKLLFKNRYLILLFALSILCAISEYFLYIAFKDYTMLFLGIVIYICLGIIIIRTWPDERTFSGISMLSHASGLDIRGFSSLGGIVDGRKIKVTYSTEDRSGSTTIPEKTLFYFDLKEELPEKLRIGYDSAIYDLDKKIGLQDIDVSSQNFNSKFLIMGNDEMQVKEYLTESRQKNLLRLHEIADDLDIKKGKLIIEIQKDLPGNLEEFLSIYNTILQSARELDTSFEESERIKNFPKRPMPSSQRRKRFRYRLWISSLILMATGIVIGFAGNFTYQNEYNANFELAYNWAGIPILIICFLPLIGYALKKSDDFIKAIKSFSVIFFLLLVLSGLYMLLFFTTSGWINHFNALTSANFIKIEGNVIKIESNYSIVETKDKKVRFKWQRVSHKKIIKGKLRKGGLGYMFIYPWDNDL